MKTAEKKGQKKTLREERKGETITSANYAMFWNALKQSFQD